MVEEKSRVSHKELLTFSNLTNLEWEFVNLESIKEPNGDSLEGDNANATQLNLLLDPEVFVREYDDGTTEHRYGADEEGNLINQEQGLAEMRKKDRAILLYTSFIKKPKPQLLHQSRGNKIELASQSCAQT